MKNLLTIATVIASLFQLVAEAQAPAGVPIYRFRSRAQPFVYRYHRHDNPVEGFVFGGAGFRVQPESGTDSAPVYRCVARLADREVHYLSSPEVDREICEYRLARDVGARLVSWERLGYLSTRHRIGQNRPLYRCDARQYFTLASANPQQECAATESLQILGYW